MRRKIISTQTVVKSTLFGILLLSTGPSAAMSSASLTQTTLKRVPQGKLGNSKPPPEWFGIPPNANDPSWTEKNWLFSRFHFSFAEYNNPRNQNFGVLRVMNDDLVQPDRGFGEHPHANVEICTYVVRGELTHADTLGTKETLGRGSVQFMTAGTGVSHSERNLSKENPLRFIQIWITTRQRNLRPNYGSTKGVCSDRLNRWSHLVSDASNSSVESPIKINQDANIMVAEVDSGVNLELEVKEGRQCYVLAVEGSVKVEEPASSVLLLQHDGLEVRGPAKLAFSSQVTSGEKAHVLVVEMALDRSSGRSDL